MPPEFIKQNKTITFYLNKKVIKASKIVQYSWNK